MERQVGYSSAAGITQDHALGKHSQSVQSFIMWLERPEIGYYARILESHTCFLLQMAQFQACNSVLIFFTQINRILS